MWAGAPFSPTPKPVPQRQAPSPLAVRGHLSSPHARRGDPRRHQLSGTDRKKPHEMNVELLVRQKCCMGSRAQGRSGSPRLARWLPAVMAVFAEPDAAQSGIVNEVPVSLDTRPAQCCVRQSCQVVCQKLDGNLRTAFPSQCPGHPAPARLCGQCPG